MHFRRAALALAVICPVFVTATVASAAEESPGAGVLSLLPEDSVTEHTLDTGHRTISYTATAGTLSLYGQDGAVSAKIFYTAYVAKDGAADRPLTFAFNGGPGAASAYLNLGLVGPRILDFGPDGHDGTAAKLVDNKQSWLDFTDLVLIDPVGTGWSRPAKADDASSFYGVRQDAESLAKAIALYVTHNNRASSAKYILGESYGGFRAAKVASALKDSQGILTSGIVMVSPLIEGQLLFGANRFALGAAFQLPSLAAAELERRNAFSEEAVAQAEKFAMTDYLTTLAGPTPTGEAARSFYTKVSELTGIPVDVVAKGRGFLSDSYVKHSIDGDRVVSPYDAAFTVPDAYPESGSDRGDDPVLDGFTRAYAGSFANYARNELGFKTEMTYTLLSGDVNSRWEWGGERGGGSRSQASATDDIRDLLSLTPSFRLLVAQGYSDIVTPYSINRYVVDHLPPKLAADRVALNLYRGGHMFYTRDNSRIEFSADAKAFYARGHNQTAPQD